MAKRSKKATAELDAAIDQLGGGTAPISRRSKPQPTSRADSKPATKKLTAKRKKR